MGAPHVSALQRPHCLVVFDLSQTAQGAMTRKKQERKRWRDALAEL